MNYCKIVRKQKMLEKKKDCLGLNYKSIGIILLLVFFLVFTFIICRKSIEYGIQVHKQYLLNKKIEQENLIKKNIEKEKLEKYKLEQEEKIKLESIRQKELIEESIKQRKSQVEYEEKIIKQICPKGTYLYNSKINQVGQVKIISWDYITTDVGWSFYLENKAYLPDYITMIGKKEYLNGIDKLLKNKSLSQEEQSRLSKIYSDKKAEDTKFTLSLFKIKNYGDNHYFRIKDKYYRVKKIDGLIIYTYEKETFMSDNSGIEEISWLEYEKGKGEK